MRSTRCRGLGSSHHQLGEPGEWAGVWVASCLYCEHWQRVPEPKSEPKPEPVEAGYCARCEDDEAELCEHEFCPKCCGCWGEPA